ncbi:MAG: caspase family protein, partial [Myxococcota bacterium]
DDRKQRPSRAALADAFTWLTQAKPHHTVVVFFAGHGVAHRDPVQDVDDYFYLLPQVEGPGDVERADLRRERTFAAAELAAALNRVPATKRLIILDTCAAGKADLRLAQRREGLSSDARRAHDRAQESTGAWFLAGAAADRASYEASQFGQGILTYTLLEGMRGAALSEDQVWVSRLVDHAEKQVPV